jgi:host factor-I protein
MPTNDNNNPNAQDAFLAHIRRTNEPVTVFLTNGVKLQGRLTWFDGFSIALTRDGVTQLVYKHAISTVMPSSQFQIGDLLDTDDEGDY